MKSALTFIIISLSINLFGQDSHYWTNQYGTRGQLLSGAVVGSIEDLSSTYYNPGAIAFTKDMNVLLTTDAFELVEINIPDGAGKGLNLKSTGINPTPNIFALKFDFLGSEKHQWAISLLTKRDFDFEVQKINVQNGITSEPNSVNSSAEILNNNKLTEPWFGISWAYRVSDQIGVGITQYLAMRGHKQRFQTTKQVSDSIGQSALNLTRDFKYYNLRLLWKFGLIYKLEKLNIGFTITTPSFNLYGYGRYYINYSLIDNTGNLQSELYSLYESDLNAFYKSALSIAAGISYSIENSKIYFSSEWFNALKQFHIFDMKDITYEISGEPLQVQLTHGLRSLVNYGIGYQQKISKKFAVYLGFNTDFSATENDNTSNITISNYDIFHFTIGSSFTLYDIDFNLGLGYGFSNKALSEVLNINEVLREDQNPEKELTNVKYQRIKLIVGLSL